MRPFILSEISLLDHSADFRRVKALRARPILPLISSSLTRCREGIAQVLEGLDPLQEYATKVDGVLCPGTWLH